MFPPTIALKNSTFRHKGGVGIEKANVHFVFAVKYPNFEEKFFYKIDLNPHRFIDLSVQCAFVCMAYKDTNVNNYPRILQL